MDKLELALKALLVIQEICCNENPMDENETLNKIYRLAHAGESPSCRNSHLAWEKELLEDYDLMVKHDR